MMASSDEAAIDRMCIQCDGPDCSAWGPSKRCSRCLRDYYCSKNCQIADWKEHKAYCKAPVKTSFEKIMASGVDEDKINAVLQTVGGTGDGDNIEAVNTECPICFATPPNNAVVLSACRHSFCYSCLFEWQKHVSLEASLNQRIRVGKSGTPCPYCKSTETEDVEEDLLHRADLLLVGVNLPVNSEKQKESLKKQALSCVDKVLMGKNAKMDAYVTKAKILLALGLHSEAMRAVDEAIDENEKRKAHPMLVLAEAAKAAEARGDMAEYYLKVVAIGEHQDKHSVPLSQLNNYAECKLIKCEALEAQNNFQEAFDLYMEVTKEMTKPIAGEDESKFHDTVYKSMVGFARCSYEMGKFEHAVTCSDGVMNIYRHRPNVHKYKALSLKKLGKIDEAITVMQRAILYETPWNIDTKHNAEVWQLYKELCAERDAQNS